MNNNPLILITNDDGMFAPGIKKLINIAKKFGEVVVVAPDSPQSGKGHAVTLSHPLRLNKVNVFEGIEAYECSGTPVDCVKLAKYIVLSGREIDICLSGINHGANSSVNILYSGTMSAAMEASIEGIDSIGFSLLDFSFDADFEPCTPYVEAIIKYALEHKLNNGKLLNVNIPKLPADDIKGIKVCKQAEGRWIEEFVEAEDPRGEKYYWMTGKFLTQDDRLDTDLKALKAGYISVVPSKHDLTDYPSIDELKPLQDIVLDVTSAS